MHETESPELMEKNALPFSLFEICAALTSTLEHDELLNRIISLALKEYDAQRGSILLFDPDSDTLKMLASIGMPSDIAEQGYIPRKGSIAEWVIANDKPLILHQAVREDEERFSSISEHIPTSSMCCPLRAKGRVIGTLNLSRIQSNPFPFDENDLNTLQIIATQAAISIENARLIQKNIENAQLAAIGQTVSSVSHCVKNMLTGLKGGIALGELAMEKENWESMRSSWDMMKRSVNRISLLVLDLLDYSKTRTPIRKACRIRSLVDEAIGTVQLEAKKRKVQISASFEEQLTVANLDGDQIFRCILNILTNAMEAVVAADGLIQKDRHIRVSVSRLTPESTLYPKGADRQPDHSVLAIRIEDNGCGMPPEAIDTIFRPFFSTKGSKGTGIGLAVTQKIIHEHGGWIHVESNLNRGSVFTLVIPCPENL